MIHIEPATINDLDFVYACITELTQQNFEKSVFETVYKNLLASGYCYPFVITNNNESIGYMGMHIQPQLHHNGPVAEIQELVVLPGFRSSGVGKVALDFARTFSREKGCVLLELASSMKRTDAHRFYLDNGFTQSHYKFTCPLEG